MNINFNESEFTKDQLDEIRWGREQGIDTTLYESPKFTNYQMREIRLGILDNLEASVYADPKF